MISFSFSLHSRGMLSDRFQTDEIAKVATYRRFGLETLALCLGKANRIYAR